MTTPGLRAEQVAEAFNAVSGQTINVLRNVASGAITSSTTTFAEIDSTNLSGSFVVPVSGKYRIHYDGEMRINTYGSSTYATPQLQILIDGSTVVGGSDADWYWSFQSRVPAQQWFRNAYHDEVELSAGVHTFQLRWKVKAQSASGATMEMNAGSVQHITATLVSGSGAGGIIKTATTLGQAWTSTFSGTGVWQAVQGTVGDVTITADFFENEEADLDIQFNVTPSTDSTDGHYTIGIGIDGANPDSSTSTQFRLTRVSGSNQDVFRGTYTCHIGPMTAGSHVFKLYAIRSTAISGTGEIYFFDSSGMTLKQYRGGQVPWERDGVSVIDTPRAINVIGGAMSVSDDGTSKLNIQLPEAVTASGVDVTLFSYSDTGPNDLTSTSYATLPSASFDVVIPAAGTYKIEMAGSGIIWSGAGGAYFRILLDDTTAIHNGPWRIWSGAGDVNKRIPFAASTTVELTEGTHNFKIQYFVNSGVTLRTDANQIFKGSAQRISGSGAGGLIVTEMTGNSTVTLAATETEYDIKSATINCFEGESVVVFFDGQYKQGMIDADHHFNLLIQLDGVNQRAVSRKHQSYVQNTDRFPFALCGVIENISSGQHTVAVKVSTGTGQADTTGQVESCDATVVQYRGGLVPVKKDGVAVLDTPQSFNFVGPNTDVQNVSGQANITFNGISEGLVVSGDAPVSAVVLAAASTVYTLATADITIEENENVILFFTANYKRGGTGVFGFNVDSQFGGTFQPRVHSIKKASGTASDRYPISFPMVINNKPAGTYTVNVVATTMGDHVDTSGQVEDIDLYLVRSKGGYTQKENEPVLGTFSGDSVTLVAAPGASNESLLVLNDGVRYRATLPLTCDLTTTGEGGREASKSTPSGIDHWFLYAIPSSTTGQWAVIGTTKSPGDGGPDDYSVWKYLHPLIRYDGTNEQPTGLLPMTVGSDGWYRLDERLPMTEIAALSAFQTLAYINVPELPQSTDQMDVSFILRTDGNAAGDRGIFFWYKNTSSIHSGIFVTTWHETTQLVESVGNGIVQLSEGSTNRCAIKIEANGSPVFNAAFSFITGFTDRYKRVGGDSSPKLITSGEYVYTDEFNDSVLDPKWTTGTTGGGGSISEGTDGLTISVNSGSVSGAYSRFELSEFMQMNMRNWEIACHVEFLSTEVDTSVGGIYLYGNGGGVGKYMGARFMKQSSSARLELVDSGSATNTVLGGDSDDGLWIRLRKWGDSIRADYYLGANTVDVDGGGYWREYDGKDWWVVPQSGTFDYPTMFTNLRLQVNNWDSTPAVSYKFSKFRFRIF